MAGCDEEDLVSGGDVMAVMAVAGGGNDGGLSRREIRSVLVYVCIIIIIEYAILLFNACGCMLCMLCMLAGCEM